MSSGGLKGSVTSIWNVAHENSDQKMYYYVNLFDLNSIRENLIGTRTAKRVVPLVKADSGKLHRVDDIRLTESYGQWSTEQIKK